MITPEQAIEFNSFMHTMRFDNAVAVYQARLACFCGHTLPQIDARNINEAVRAGVVFG